MIIYNMQPPKLQKKLDPSQVTDIYTLSEYIMTGKCPTVAEFEAAASCVFADHAGEDGQPVEKVYNKQEIWTLMRDQRTMMAKKEQRSNLMFGVATAAAVFFGVLFARDEHTLNKLDALGIMEIEDQLHQQ